MLEVIDHVAIHYEFFICRQVVFSINLFHVTGLFLYPLKTSSDFLMFSGGIKEDHVA